MKSILSLAFALVALLSVSSVVAQNRHWVVDPTAKCGDHDVTISGKAAGLATGPLYARLTGYYDCVNNGTQVPGSDNWSILDVTRPAGSKSTGGNLLITVLLQSLCDHANWGFATRQLKITLYATQSDATNDVNRLLGPTDVTPDCIPPSK